MRRQHFSHALLMFWVVFLPLRNLCLVWRTNINIRFLIDKMSHLLFLRKHPVLQVKWVVNAVSFWFNCVRSQKLQKAENNVSSVCVPERPQTQKQTLWSCWHKCVSENHTHSDGHRTDPDANRRRCCVCVCVCTFVCYVHVCLSSPHSMCPLPWSGLLMSCHIQRFSLTRGGRRGPKKQAT